MKPVQNELNLPDPPPPEPLRRGTDYVPVRGEMDRCWRPVNNVELQDREAGDEWCREHGTRMRFAWAGYDRETGGRVYRYYCAKCLRRTRRGILLFIAAMIVVIAVGLIIGMSAFL